MKKVLFLVGVLMLPFLAKGQDQVAKYKSVFTLSFIRYIGWPEEVKQGDFVIGVLKDKTVANWLKDLSKGKKFGYQSVVIKEFKSVDEVTNCQVLYVSDMINMSKHGAKIVEKVGGKNTLIITEKDGATKYGGMINFVIKDDKLKFEIKKDNASRFGLPISSKLSAMNSAITL
jgi:hypothetical protein